MARLLTTRGAEVVVVMGDDEADRHVAALLGPEVRVAAGDDRAEALRLADLPGTACLLALADDDLDKRSFAPVLADQLE